MSLSSTYQGRKSLFAEKLEDKGVEASATDGLTTLINKIDDIEEGFTEGLLIYAENNIVQKDDTVDLYALLLQDGKPVPNKTVDFIGLYTVIAGKVCHVPSHYRFEKFGYLNATVYLDADHHFKIGPGALFYKDDVEQSSAKVYSIEVNQNTLTVVYMGGTTSTFDVSNYDMSVIESTVNISDIICYASGTTGSDGVASYTYTGVGEGLKEVYAKYGTLVSEIYSILDCYAYDGMTDTDHNDIWQLTNTNMTRTDEGTTFIADGGGQNTVRLKIGNLTNYIPSTSDFVIEFSLKTTSQSTCYLTLQNTDNKTSTEFPTPYNVLNDYKLVYIANDKKVYRYMNGSQTPSAQYDADMGGADVGFKFVDWQSDMNLLVKNFKIYPV